MSLEYFYNPPKKRKKGKKRKSPKSSKKGISLATVEKALSREGYKIVYKGSTKKRAKKRKASSSKASRVMKISDRLMQSGEASNRSQAMKKAWRKVKGGK